MAYKIENKNNLLFLLDKIKDWGKKRMSNYIKKGVDLLNENGYLLPREYLSKLLRFITNDIAHIASSLAGQHHMLAFFLLYVRRYFLRIALLKLHDFKCPT